jgi:hypothetical protein
MQPGECDEHLEQVVCDVTKAPQHDLGITLVADAFRLPRGWRSCAATLTKAYEVEPRIEVFDQASERSHQVGRIG